MFIREDIGTESTVVTFAKKKGTYVKRFKVIEINWCGTYLLEGEFEGLVLNARKKRC